MIVIIILTSCKIRMYISRGESIMKKIDSNKTVYELIKENPELKPVLVDMGFTPLNDDRMLNTVGRMMSLKNGAKQINLNEKELVEHLREANFELE